MSHFIKQFAEKSKYVQPSSEIATSTATSTRSIEGSDQDASADLFIASMGTATGTATVEGPDQDQYSNWIAEQVLAMATCTCTESIEGEDQDKAVNFFSHNI